MQILLTCSQASPTSIVPNKFNRHFRMPYLLDINSNVKLQTINTIHLEYQKGGEIAGKFLDKVTGGKYSTRQMCLCLPWARSRGLSCHETWRRNGITG
jgi:hypothetical protein